MICCWASLSAQAYSSSVAAVWYCFGLLSLISWLFSGLAQQRVSSRFFSIFFSLRDSGFNSPQEHSNFGHRLFISTFLIIKLTVFLSCSFCRKNIWLFDSFPRCLRSPRNLYQLRGGKIMHKPIKKANKVCKNTPFPRAICWFSAEEPGVLRYYLQSW